MVLRVLVFVVPCGYFDHARLDLHTKLKYEKIVGAELLHCLDLRWRGVGSRI